MLRDPSQLALVRKILTTVGLCCDALGAILLGVEAVKLENVRRFSGWADRRGHAFFRDINPEMVVEHDVPPVSRRESALSAVAVTLYMAAGLVLGGPILYGIYELARVLGSPSFGNLPWWGVVLVALGAIWAALALAAALVTGAEALLDVALRLIQIQRLDEHTPTGGVGIVGVIILVGGFVLQVAATWIE